jgi:4-hydroxy 2-oxovalerate aldolase
VHTKPIKVLDCTLRDGGYYNNWDFPIDVVKSYLESLSELDIFGIELGFRSNLKATHRGPFAHTTEASLESLKLPDKFLYAVMLNASELDDGLSGVRSQINQLFVDAKKSKLGLVRIATYYDDLPKAVIIGEELKSKGYLVAVNLMGVNIDESRKVMEKINIESIKEIFEVFYLADSNGRLFPNQFAELVELFDTTLGIPIGVHTHDNRGLAFSNSLAALSNGATWVDATVTGMGRGPGNTKLEALILELDLEIRENPNRLGKLQNVINSYFGPEQKRLKWGTNLFYHLAAQQDIHPLRIQELLSNTGINSNQLLDLLTPKSNASSSRFLEADDTAKTQAIHWLDLNLKNRNVLIVANENLVSKHKFELNAFISKHDPFVVSVNGAGLEYLSNVELVTASYETRILESFKLAEKFGITFLSPHKVNNTEGKKQAKAHQINYPLEISEKHFEVSDLKLILNGDESIPYIISVLLLRNPKIIWLAGVSGYVENNSSHTKLLSFFSNLHKLSFKTDIISITPTSLPIKAQFVSELI